MARLATRVNIAMRQLHPATMVLWSFLSAIGLGSLLLTTPLAARGEPVSFIDALFTATSAVCVTGLVVVDTGSVFSLFGQGVILALIQAGGLGVMTLAVTVFLLLGRGIPFREGMALRDCLTFSTKQDIVLLIRSLLLFTFLAEACGAGFLFLTWVRDHPWDEAAYLSVFHAVSAFCNAGFSPFADNLVAYRGHPLVNGVIGGLIVLGGIGFPVVHDLQGRFRAGKRRRYKLSVQTRAVLLTTGLLIFSGALAFAILEWERALAGAPLMDRILASLFQSITCRTAGFNTVDIGTLDQPTLALMIFLMFFGASPGSTGGGVKTTTLALIAAFAWSRIKGESIVNLFRKTVPPDTINRSTSLLLMSLGLISVVLFLLLLAMGAGDEEGPLSKDLFLTCLFETVSAFGTVGLSMNFTPSLNPAGKVLIVVMMIIGRVGVLTFSYIFIQTRRPVGLEHAEENLMVG